MYEYRRLTPTQRAELVQQRLSRGYPPHAPPHVVTDKEFYLLTAACYEHKCHVKDECRRQELLNLLFDAFVTAGMEIRAWVVLPNHYHLLVHLTNFDELSRLFRLVHGRTSYQWNRDDNVTRRKVWYRYSDRAIRSERHYFAALNYLHYNPVKHGWSQSPYDWRESSVHWYLANFGRQWLRDAWIEYPVRDYGKDWDDFEEDGHY
ncbi:REP-associated tyrosine transposase [Coleofasciculus sp. F4-SAH-05]|uniref:REP-associated tyrosine transposase n=1 Tax=Coleofasciculus sp. F4-SAH-05 TaxID=3069525 RepID=UPI0032F87955